MNAKLNLKTRFAPETRFELAPVPIAPFRGARENELDRLKAGLLSELLNENPEPELNAPLRRAANEAAALVWFTPCPLLLFPALFEEKARVARRQIERQNQISERSQSLFVGAV